MKQYTKNLIYKNFIKISPYKNKRGDFFFYVEKIAKPLLKVTEFHITFWG